jgi:hypothetical protein
MVLGFKPDHDVALAYRIGLHYVDCGEVFPCVRSPNSMPVGCPLSYQCHHNFHRNYRRSISCSEPIITSSYQSFLRRHIDFDLERGVPDNRLKGCNTTLQKSWKAWKTELLRERARYGTLLLVLDDRNSLYTPHPLSAVVGA